SAQRQSCRTRSCGEARAAACDASGLCVIACSFAQWGGRAPAVGAGRASDPPVAAAALQRLPFWEATVPYNACVPQAPGGPVLLLRLRQCANARLGTATALYATAGDAACTNRGRRAEQGPYLCARTSTQGVSQELTSGR